MYLIIKKNITPDDIKENKIYSKKLNSCTSLDGFIKYIAWATGDKYKNIIKNVFLAKYNINELYVPQRGIEKAVYDMINDDEYLAEQPIVVAHRCNKTKGHVRAGNNRVKLKFNKGKSTIIGYGIKLPEVVRDKFPNWFEEHTLVNNLRFVE